MEIEQENSNILRKHRMNWSDARIMIDINKKAGIG